jgi:hypothetical protein
MSLIAAILSIIIIIQTWQPFCAGSLFIKEDQVCDPMRTNIVVYTGFRFTRQYTFIPPRVSVFEPWRAMSAAAGTTGHDSSLRERLKRKAKQIPLKSGTVRHYLRLTHCTKGRVDYEGYISMPRNSGFVWGVDVCGFHVHKEGILEQAWRTARGAIMRTKKVVGSPWEHTKKAWGWVDMLRTERSVNDTAEALATALNAQRKKDIDKDRLTNPQRPSEWCYRAVRRKKYALREVSIYMPNTFVGGLFLCPRSVAAGGSADCTNANAVPIAPLYADPALNSPFSALETVRDTNPAYELYKLSRSRRLFHYTPFAARRIVNRVAYFYTKNTVTIESLLPFNAPVEATVEVAGEWPAWARLLDVNEQYTYTSGDLSSLNEAITLTGNLLQSLFSLGSKKIPWEHTSTDDLFNINHKNGDMVPVNVDQSTYDINTARENLGLGTVLVGDIWRVVEKLKLRRDKTMALLQRLQEPFNVLDISY